MFMYVARRGIVVMRQPAKPGQLRKNSIQVVTCKCAETDPERCKGCVCVRLRGEGMRRQKPEWIQAPVRDMR